VPNLDKAGESGILGNLKMNGHSIADIHRRAGQQVQAMLAYVIDQTEIR
jgi:lambda repressor-like predicted transcriptional regulator